MTSPLFEHLLANRLPGIGPSKFLELIESFGSIHHFLESDPALCAIGEPARVQMRAYQRAGSASEIAQHVEAELEWCEREAVNVLCLADSDYPELLKHIHRPPPVLYLRGETQQLHRPQLAIVGSRKPSGGGLESAFDFAVFLAESGFTVTSGLALGIDGAAHRGALKGCGNTVAVLGCGIDQVYPARHRGLAQQIIETGGAIVSEFPLGTAPEACLFPQRNRIISGLSLGVLVIEAALRSGSLISAREANSQGREVFALPGSIHSPLSRGCHKLIKEGATLVENAQDLIQELGGLMALKSSELSTCVQQTLPLETSVQQANKAAKSGATRDQPDSLNKEEARLLGIMGYDPCSMDKLLELSDFDLPQLSVLLLGLELKSRVRRTPYGYEQCGSK